MCNPSFFALVLLYLVMKALFSFFFEFCIFKQAYSSDKIGGFTSLHVSIWLAERLKHDTFEFEYKQTDREAGYYRISANFTHNSARMR